MSKKILNRKSYEDEFKVKVVLEAISGNFTLSELSSKYEVHPNLIMKWKAKFLSLVPCIFRQNTDESQEIERLRKENERLVHQIGEQAVDINFLKKNLKKFNLF